MKVLVTGASRGIGRAVCEALAPEHDVVGVYRANHEAARSLAAQVAPGASRAPGSLVMLAHDLGSDAGVAELIAGLSERLQGEALGGLVLNAGVSQTAGFVRSSARGAAADGDPLRYQLRSNLEAPLVLLRGLLEAEAVARGASVVVISSNLARHSVLGHVAYAAAKGGLEAAVRQLCVELGPRQIRINAVAPGIIRTDMTAHMDQAALDAYACETPLGRPGLVTDVAQVVQFFLGVGSAYVTGQVLDVDGGWGAR